MTRKRELRIGGFVPFSAADYPHHLAAVVFCQGCPWRCGYCHNAHLQALRSDVRIAWAAVVAFLAKRRGLLDAVVFSGGEPTIQAALADAMLDVRALGYKVGLHTAGIHPRRLSQVLPLVDWIGLDIKAPFANYARVTRVPASGAQARKSAELVLASGVAHEFRTTNDPALLGAGDIEQLSTELSGLGARHHVLQECRMLRA